MRGNVSALLAMLLVVAACGGAEPGIEIETVPETVPETETSVTTAAPATTAAPVATSPPITDPSAAELAKSVVQIVVLDAFGQVVWTGSGTAVSEDGLILTNAHVVDDRFGEYDDLVVAVAERTDQLPEPTYLAEIVAVDYGLDLAVIRAVTDMDGRATDFSLPTIPLGDSDLVELGDTIQILGFPGIGGATVTFTEGSISGFTAQRAVADRAWIKTDATIAGGNSGGLAANEAGEIIGVPSLFGASPEAFDAGGVVDCRIAADTNMDGWIDGGDDCVPVGGFINALRPIGLALPLIDAAEAGRTYVATTPEEPAPTPPETDTFTFDPPPAYEQTVPGNGAGWAANGSGCVPGGDSIPDGVWFGFVNQITYDAAGNPVLDFDMGCLYTGAAALAEATHDNATLSGGLYVRNVNPLIFNPQVAPWADVFWLDYSGFHRLTTLDDWFFVANQAVLCPGNGCSVWISVFDGWIVSIDEQQIP